MPKLSIEAIEQIFRAEIKGLGDLPHAVLAELSAWTENELTEHQIFIRDRGRPLWARFREAAINTQEALETLRSEIPAQDWERLASRNAGLEQLREALDRLSAIGAFMADPPPAAPRRGPKMKDDEHFMAATIAFFVVQALRAAGSTGPISVTADQGPVARIGSRIAAAALDLKILPSATFADWVEKSGVAKDVAQAAAEDAAEDAARGN